MQECYWFLNTGLMEKQEALFDFCIVDTTFSSFFFLMTPDWQTKRERERGSFPERRL